MEQNMKPITKQLVIAAFILTSVTVLSLGIRQVRLSNHRANTIESPVIADTGESTPDRPSDPEDQPQPEQPLYVNAGPDNYPADSLTVDAEPDPRYADASESDKEAPSDDHSEAKSLKGNYAKTKGSKGLQKISLGDYEDLYRTGEGELWYVSKQSDGKTVKMQVQINDTTGEITVVDGGYYAKSEGSQGLQKIPMGDNDNIYITGEGELWYTSEQPDGSGASKTQVQIDEATGEIDIVDNGEEYATKD
jgi:hypothetical protein